MFSKNLIVILLLVSGTIFSQEVSNVEIINSSTSLTTFDGRSKDLVGVEYISKAFQPAKLMAVSEIYSVRFNAYQDEMEIKRNGKDYSLPKTFDYTITFLNDNKVYQVFEYTIDKVTKNGFFVVVFKSDQISLLIKEIIIFEEEVKPRTGYDKYKPPTLKRIKDKLYIAYKNNTTVELPIRKKEFYSLFSSNSKEIEKYTKTQKLNIKKIDDLIKIFNYYNTL